MSADLENRLRELPGQLGGLRADDRLAAAVRTRHRRTRRRRLTVSACAAAVIALLAGGTVAVTTLQAQPSSPPAAPIGPVPTDPRLLPWPTRGPLADDPEAVRTAVRAAAGSHPAPGDGPAHVLWIGPASVGGHVLDGVDRFAVVQQYAAGRISLAWLGGTATNRWAIRGQIHVDPAAAGASFVWSYGRNCVAGRSGAPPGCGPQDVGLLVVGAPDVTTVRYQFPGAPAELLAAAAGILLVTRRINPAVDPSGMMSAAVTVTRAGGRPELVRAGVPELMVVPASPVAAVEWLPSRGLPPLLDAPETFPGLDLWGRLHGRPGRPGYGNPVWGGTLADGSRAVVAQPSTGTGTPDHLVFAVNPPPVRDTKDTFLVRDLPNPADPEAVTQVSAFLPLSDGRCELVVVGKPGTTAVSYADGSAPSELAVEDGVGTLVLPGCDGHDGARITVRVGGMTTYEGPVDSAKAGGGVKRG